MAFFAIAEVWPLKPERISAVLGLFLFFTWQEAPFSRENGNVDFQLFKKKFKKNVAYVCGYVQRKKTPDTAVNQAGVTQTQRN